tara:strand:- start:1517 stop:3061 length:1545 start_codon:yes stop_codon:yes gene_type:complete
MVDVWNPHLENSSKLLIKHGFVKSEHKAKYEKLSSKDKNKALESLPEDDADKQADADHEEVGKDQMVFVNFPNPIHKYRLVLETFKASIEETYFWILNYLRYDMHFAQIEKITDIFAAGETSAFEGVRQQRVGLQQDKVSQFLATIGKMVKELFQLVRELRIIDERAGYYEDAFTDSKSSESAEITLKGIWIDQVEGASKNPASVYGLAKELQFTTLPDLFFAIHPKKPEDVDEVVDALEFNRKVKEVLKRKLRTFLEWKVRTYDELQNRRTFTIQYLRQHFDIIKMYMQWVKPYLRTIKRLGYDEKKTKTPDLLSAFEGTMIEIEFLAIFYPRKNKEYRSVLCMHFDYRTRPSMNYQAEGYQRGPLHVGEIRVTWRGYTWNQEEIDNYKKLREEEDFELLATVDRSVKAAMEALGDELENYLQQAGENVKFSGSKKVKKSEPKLPGMLDPFKAIFSGFGDAFKFVTPDKKPKKKKGLNSYQIDEEKSKAKKDLIIRMWTCYKNYKKGHKMISW